MLPQPLADLRSALLLQAAGQEIELKERLPASLFPALRVAWALLARCEHCEHWSSSHTMLERLNELERLIDTAVSNRLAEISREALADAERPTELPWTQQERIQRLERAVEELEKQAQEEQP